jgi:hypothetical protein
MANNYMMRVSNGNNFKKGTRLPMGKLFRLRRAGKITENEIVGYWAIAADGPSVSRDFEKNARPGDLLWFTKRGGKLLGVAEFKSMSDDRTFPSSEMNWEGEGGECRREVLYTNLILTEDCDYLLPHQEQWSRQKPVFKIDPQLSNGDNLANIYKTLRQFKNAKYE